MKPFTQTVTATAGGITYSKAFVVDRNLNPINIGIGVTVTGSAIYTVQHTFADPFSVDLHNPTTATWLNNDFLASATTNDDTNYAFAPSAIRLALSSAAAATAVFTVIQAG